MPNSAASVTENDVTYRPINDFKMVMIGAIAERIYELYPTQAAAAEALGYDRAMISRLMAGEVKRFSVAWLVTLAYRLGLKVYVEVDGGLPAPVSPDATMATEIQH